MSHSVHITVSDEAYTVLREKSETTGVPLPRLASQTLEKQLVSDKSPISNPRQASRGAARSHFGEFDRGYPLGTANEDIDADIARAIDTHGE